MLSLTRRLLILCLHAMLVETNLSAEIGISIETNILVEIDLLGGTDMSVEIDMLVKQTCQMK